MDNLLLFDIDGTLILDSHAGHTAYIRAIQTRYGVEFGMEEIPPTSGKTDLIILRELLDLIGLAEQPVDDPDLVRAYIRHLEDSVQSDPGRLAPGGRELLETLANRDDMYLALGTGNIESGAKTKLAYHDIEHFFATGGFGSDGTTRQEIIASGIEKSQRLFGTTFDRIIVIGDTPYDIACAHANNVHCIAVSTGSFTYDQLKAENADHVLEDLTDVEIFLTVIDTLSEVVK
jgi:phosphoglycolate phosphatase-like HAD superfamily hydrolase